MSIPVPREFKRPSELDVLDALDDAGIDLNTEERQRVVQALRAKVAANQRTYCEIVAGRK